MVVEISGEKCNYIIDFFVVKSVFIRKDQVFYKNVKFDLCSYTKIINSQNTV